MQIPIKRLAIPNLKKLKLWGSNTAIALWTRTNSTPQIKQTNKILMVADWVLLIQQFLLVKNRTPGHPDWLYDHSVKIFLTIHPFSDTVKNHVD